MNTDRESAKRLLRHYFTLVASYAGVRLDNDSHFEIGAIVDHIIAAAKDEMAAPSIGRTVPLQAAEPLTLGAAADDDHELWGIWLIDEGQWHETPGGLIRYGYSYSLACAGAHNATKAGHQAEARRIDLWAAESE